jgi:predicted dehydrogenase
VRVGLIGTSAVAHKHAQACRNIGHELVVCTNRNPERGRMFADQYRAEFVTSVEEVCSDPRVDYVDVCTFPQYRLEPVVLCARAGKPVLVEKPMATDLETARRMLALAREAGIALGVVSQHRFDESSLFLIEAIRKGRLGDLLECDCYVKWYRPPSYYARPEKGSFRTEGGGALINQAIHQLDLLLWFAGPVKRAFGTWQLGAAHQMESEDVVSAVLQYESGATGVVQASTAIWPGYPERIEIHGTRGSALVSGDRLVAWDVDRDRGEPPPLRAEAASGASDPMAISLESFERQLGDFGEAIRSGRAPRVSGREGFEALALVMGIYQSCRTGEAVRIESLPTPERAPG